jgi:guanine nucleotide-binding protein subunit beta, other
LQYHPSGFTFATGSEDKTARLFDIRADQQIALYKAPSGTPGFTSCGLSKSGRLILCGSDDMTVHCWDTMKNQHNGNIFCFLFFLKMKLLTNKVKYKKVIYTS